MSSRAFWSYLQYVLPMVQAQNGLLVGHTEEVCQPFRAPAQKMSQHLTNTTMWKASSQVQTLHFIFYLIKCKGEYWAIKSNFFRGPNYFQYASHSQNLGQMFTFFSHLIQVHWMLLLHAYSNWKMKSRSWQQLSQLKVVQCIFTEQGHPFLHKIHIKRCFLWLVVYWSKAQKKEQTFEPISPSPTRRMQLVDEFFLFCCRVAAGLQEKVLADMFQVSVSTVSRVIITWANYLYLLLGSLPIWMSKQQVKNTMPSKFVQYSPDVRVIIDCTEVRCQNPSSLTLQSEVFSSYKNTTTLKALIGIAPLLWP